MDNNLEKFTSINDLYQRILPALRTKVAELKREKVNFINEKDIWHYCTQTKWKNRTDLRIYEMVSDVLEVDPVSVKMFFKINNL